MKDFILIEQSVCVIFSTLFHKLCVPFQLFGQSDCRRIPSMRVPQIAAWRNCITGAVVRRIVPIG